ncbi:TonB-dependent receptor [Paraglaciecola chathamensis]|uniref:TonB-dependent receptor n=1 Tax=Paraglaciecola chathamensis TaxID=368405 RepID=UPI0026FDA881|nr:TonB-dependent receptor [Paraglaciecola chathamensis]MDO6560522.1 TonB-dependent receptor plug domain-containing protein [Paraglaciecola chathamensis]
MNMHFSRSKVAQMIKLALMAPLVSMPLGAMAQETAPDTETVFDQEVIEQIEVTSRYRKETLNKIPISVTTFSADDIEEAGLRNINDIAVSAVGMSMERTFGRQSDIPVIRGVSWIPGFGSQKASYFIDGVYFGGSIQSLPLDLIERVEIVKGPQSAQYGRRTFSGAINFITSRPSDELSGYVNLTLGQNGNQKLAAGVSSKLSDMFAFRASVSADSYDGDWENTKEDGPDVGGEKTKSGMLGFYFTPSKNTDISVNYIYNENDDEAQPFGYQGAADNNCFLDTRPYYCGEALRNQPISIGGGGFLDNDDYGLRVTSEHISFKVNHHFDFGTLSWISGWNSRDGETGLDQTYNGAEESFSFGFFSGGPFLVPADSWYTLDTSGTDEYSHEIRFNSSAFDDRLYWSVGAYLWHSEAEPNAVDSFAEELENQALMAMATYEFTDDFRLSAEIRRSSDEVNTQAYDTLIQNEQFADVTNEFDSTTTRFIAEYDVSDDTLMYLTRSEGNSPGGFNTSTLLPDDLVVIDEEDMVMYELGVKSTMFDGKLYVSAATYTMDWTKQQLTDSFDEVEGPPVSYTSNAGSTEIKGLEIEGTWLINENFSLEFGLSRTDAQFEELFDSNQCRFFAPGGASSFCVGDNLREFGDLKGNSPPQVPKNEATLALSYSTQVKEGVEVFSRMDFSYDSSRYAHVHNLIETGSRQLVNLKAGVQLENVRLTAWVNNVTDNDTPTYVFRYVDVQSFAYGSRAFPVAPSRGREVGITASYKF